MGSHQVRNKSKVMSSDAPARVRSADLNDQHDPSRLMRMSDGVSLCVVSTLITPSRSSVLAAVPASTVARGTSVHVKHGRQDRATGPTGPATWIS